MGIRGAALSQQLQLDADLTLETAKKKIRQREVAGEQNKELEGAAERDIRLEAVCYRKQPKGRGPNLLKGRYGKAKNCAKLDVRSLRNRFTPSRQMPRERGDLPSM